MFGIRLILILAVMGGIIAFIADKLGSKIGKKRMSIFGLRPHDTSVVLTVLSGVLIAACTIGVLSVSSQSARTALFGMDKLNKEMAALTEQRQAAEREVENKNKLIAGLDDAIKAAQDAKIAAENNLNVAKNELATAKEQYATAQSSLVAAHSEVDNLSQARDKLNAEIKELNTETANLKQGLMTMKEGQVLYRSGEVVFAGVLNATDNQAEIDKEIQWLVSNANMAALERLGMKPDASLEPTWILKDDIESLRSTIATSKTNLLVRVRAVANTVAGQPIVCGLNVYPNKNVFKSGTLIYRKVVDMDEKNVNAENKFMQFLNDVNKLSVEAGVLPDPVTGKVGAMNAEAILDAVKKMQRTGGKVLLSAYADGDIPTAGPVRIKPEVEAIADGNR
jgi:uncharacterized protein (DUF3084 family)